MVMRIVVAVTIFSASAVDAFIAFQIIRRATWSQLYTEITPIDTRDDRKVSQRLLTKVYSFHDQSNSSCQNPCDKLGDSMQDNDDVSMDRREASFAMLGTLWAVGSVAIPTWLLFPNSAPAEYGADANLFIPNPYDALNDRATKACLVESLGNRQCLVYADEANFLYKGADDGILIERIEKASNSLGTIPALVSNKKWSQVTGVLTGPMGELIRNMGQLAALSKNTEQTTKLIKALKNDLYSMSDGVSRKDQDLVLKHHERATNDLVAFLKAL